jgi:transposase
MVGDVSRTKNRIKAKYREHGVAPSGKRAYGDVRRKECLSQVKREQGRFQLEVLYRKLEMEEDLSDEVFARLVKMMRTDARYKLLKQTPGMGETMSAVAAAVVDDPHRFANKRKLWNYCGLGLAKPWSNDPSKAKVRGRKGGNRLMKCAAHTAATTALRGENRFSRYCREAVAKGKGPSMAKRTAARKIMATALVLMKIGAAYDDDAI